MEDKPIRPVSVLGAGHIGITVSDLDRSVFFYRDVLGYQTNGLTVCRLVHADARMTEKHDAHLAPSHIAQLIRAKVPQLSGTAASGAKASGGAPRKPGKVTRLRG
jgi:catechol 2,3-dioxygenase-like lactoylglutathione lyase family enzyme